MPQLPVEFCAWLDVRQRQLRLGLEEEEEEDADGSSNTLSLADCMDNDILIESINTDVLRLVSKDLSISFSRLQTATTLTWEDCVRSTSSHYVTDRITCCGPDCVQHFSSAQLRRMLDACPSVTTLRLFMHQSSYLEQDIDVIIDGNDRQIVIKQLVIEDVTRDFTLHHNALFTVRPRVRSLTVEGLAVVAPQSDNIASVAPQSAVCLSALALSADVLEELVLTNVMVTGDVASMVALLGTLTALKRLCVTLTPAEEEAQQQQRPQKVLTSTDWVAALAALPHHPSLRAIDMVGVYSINLLSLLSQSITCVSAATSASVRLHAAGTLTSCSSNSELDALRETAQSAQATAMAVVGQYNTARDRSVTAIDAIAAAPIAGQIELLSLSPDANVWEGVWSPFSGFHAIAAFRSLRTLDVKRNVMLSDGHMCAIAAGCPLLRDLYIEYCVFVGDIGIMAVAKHCPHMVTLDIRSTCIGHAGIQTVLCSLRKLGFLFIDARWCMIVQPAARDRNWQCIPLGVGHSVCYTESS